MLALPFLLSRTIFPQPGTCRFDNGGRLQHLRAEEIWRERLPMQYVTKSISLTLYIPMSSFLKFLYILKSQQVVDINFQRIGNSHQVAQVGL